MKIAVAFDKKSENIIEDMRHVEYFMIYEFDGNVFVNVEMISTMGKEEFQLAEILLMMETDLLMCNHIDKTLEESFYNEGIHVISGLSGSSDKAVYRYMTRGLQ